MMGHVNNLRPLGKTNLMLSPVGLGCWQFSKKKNLAGKFWPALEDETIQTIVNRSLEGGINWFDTAEAYGNGASERALSKALVSAGKKPGDVITATKWWPAFRYASSISKTIHARIEALSPFPIDLYQVHQPFGFSEVSKEMEAMAGLYEHKLIKQIGVSNFSASQMQKAWETLDKKGIPLASNQVIYNLLNRKIESNGILETAKKLGISIIAYSPLAQGLLTGKFHDNPDLIKNIGMRKFMPQFRGRELRKSLPVILLLKELAGKYSVTPSQIALNWLIHFHGDLVLVIPGATKEKHVLENTGSMSFRLSEEDMEKIDQVSSVYK